MQPKGTYLATGSCSGRVAVWSSAGQLHKALTLDSASHANNNNSNAADGDEFRRRFRDLVVAVVETPLFSGFCYTQFADTFQEVNGLLDAERRPKIPLADIAAAVRHPRTYIAGAA